MIRLSVHEDKVRGWTVDVYEDDTFLDTVAFAKRPTFQQKEEIRREYTRRDIKPGNQARGCACGKPHARGRHSPTACVDPDARG